MNSSTSPPIVSRMGNSVVNAKAPSVRMLLVCGRHYSFAVVATYGRLPSLYLYLLLAQIDNNNNNTDAHLGYLHHLNDKLFVQYVVISASQIRERAMYRLSRSPVAA
jgi:hypothetical protein